MAKKCTKRWDTRAKLLFCLLNLLLFSRSRCRRRRRILRSLLMREARSREARGMMGRWQAETLFFSPFHLPIIPFAPDAIIVSRDRSVIAYK